MTERPQNMLRHPECALHFAQRPEIPAERPVRVKPS